MRSDWSHAHHNTRYGSFRRELLPPASSFYERQFGECADLAVAG